MHNLPAWVTSRLDALKDQAIHTRCQQWLASLPEHVDLREELDRSSGLGWDTSLLQKDLTAIRSQIAGAKAQLARSRSQGADTPGDLEAKARRWVTTRAATVTVNIQSGRFEVLPDTENALALICWLFPDAIAKKLVATIASDIPQQYVADRAKMQNVARLAEELQERERREEAIVRRLIENGIAVQRRADALPQIVLGIVVNPAAIALA